MNGIIGASPAGSMLLVDRADIYCNMLSIRAACGVVEQLSRTPREMTTCAPPEGCDAVTLQKIQRDKQRNSSMQATIRSSSANINRSFNAIERIYKTKIVKFENNDDEHESKINKLHSKYTSQVERNIEARKNSISFFKGVGFWLKDLVTGVVDLGIMVGSLCTYAFCKITGTEQPEWSKDSVKTLKGMRPDTMIEAMCQSGSDSIAEKGWAYGLGYVVPDVALAVIGSKGLDKLGKAGKAKLVNKLDDLGNANNIIKINVHDDMWCMMEGRGIINGRYYSQHAMERMVPDTFSVKAQLSRRAESLAELK